MAKLKKIVLEWDNGDKRTFERDEEILPVGDISKCRRLLTEHINELED